MDGVNGRDQDGKCDQDFDWFLWRAKPLQGAGGQREGVPQGERRCDARQANQALLRLAGSHPGAVTRNQRRREQQRDEE